MEENDSALTLEHLQWFGLIIQGFARAEHIMVEILGRLHGVRQQSMTILTVPLTYSSKRDTFLASLRAFEMPDDHKEKLRWHVGQINKHNNLRNAVAHYYWKKGARAGSVRPVFYKTRGGILDIRGFDDIDTDYTASELEKLARELISSIDRFDAYRQKHGYTPLLGKSRKAAS